MSLAGQRWGGQGSIRVPVQVPVCSLLGFHHHAGQGDTRALRNLGREVLGPISNSQMRELSHREVKLPKVTPLSSECYNCSSVHYANVMVPAGRHRAS